VGSAEVMALQAAETKRAKRQVEKENIIVTLDNSSKLMLEFCIDYFVRTGKSFRTFFMADQTPVKLCLA
jgi:hypothetical protein